MLRRDKMKEEAECVEAIFLSYININLFTDTLILIPPDIRIINILLKLLEKLTIEYSLVVKIIQIEKIDYISKIFLESNPFPTVISTAILTSLT